MRGGGGLNIIKIKTLQILQVKTIWKNGIVANISEKATKYIEIKLLHRIGFVCVSRERKKGRKCKAANRKR